MDDQEQRIREQLELGIETLSAVLKLFDYDQFSGARGVQLLNYSVPKSTAGDDDISSPEIIEYGLERGTIIPSSGPLNFSDNGPLYSMQVVEQQQVVGQQQVKKRDLFLRVDKLIYDHHLVIAHKKLAEMYECGDESNATAWRLARTAYDLSAISKSTDWRWRQKWLNIGFCFLDNFQEPPEAYFETSTSSVQWWRCIFLASSSGLLTPGIRAQFMEMVDLENYRIAEIQGLGVTTTNDDSGDEDGYEVAYRDSLLHHWIGRCKFEEAEPNLLAYGLAALAGRQIDNTYISALYFFRQAEKLRPGFVENRMWIYRCQKRMRDESSALETLRSIAAASSRSEREEELIEDAVDLLRQEEGTGTR